MQFSFFLYLTLCNSVNLGANKSLVDLTPLKQLMVFPSLHHPSTLEQNSFFLCPDTFS